MAKVQKFSKKSNNGASPISCHAWSGSRSELALSHNSKDVVIYSGNSGGDWTEKALLDQHDLRVTGIDWAPKTNQIVTCPVTGTPMSGSRDRMVSGSTRWC